MVHRVKKGLDLPIAGVPEPVVEDAPPSTRAALVCADYAGLRPRVLVAVGDEVRLGQALIEDRRTPAVRLPSPANGRVIAVHRGARRALQSVVVEVDQEQEPTLRLAGHGGHAMSQLDRREVMDLLLQTGLWSALRSRPFGRVPNPDTEPAAVFVNAMDSNPLAPSMDQALAGRQEDVRAGLEALGKLTEGEVFVCVHADSTLDVAKTGARLERFAGPHPAGTVGYHIHRLHPVDRTRTVWHLGAQDAAAIGHLFRTGVLDTRRVISLAGPAVQEPRLLRTRIGASIDELSEGQLDSDGPHRVLSGSVLSGRLASGDVMGYLGRYHQQISALKERSGRDFLGWLAPGTQTFSVLPLFLSSLTPNKRFAFSTATFGGPRAMVPVGAYERVMPMDILPTHLLRALVVGDLESCVDLGCLELDEEDLALCSFVCPGKTDYGPLLRKVLDEIEAQS
jgi:Na+-transporting NADH:ubiquinone oxidoreductase subunit A